MFCEVTDDDKAKFLNDGYISFPAITTQEEVAWIREIYDQLFADRRGAEKGDMFDFASTTAIGETTAQVPQLLNPSKYDKRLLETQFRKNCLEVAQKLLGEGAEVVFEHAMMKPPFNGGVTVWHQDSAFYEKYTNYESATFWMPLQDVNQANGCLEFIPGSNNGPLLPHHSVGDDPRVHGLEAIGVDTSKAVPVPLPAGGVSIHLSGTLHYAGPNPTAAPRRAYALGIGVKQRKAILRTEHPWNVARRNHMLESMGVVDRLKVRAKDAAKSILRR